ncbi:MAG: hypothetical protein ACRDMZ_17020, partial [Solirubrobacteraceae bacterium]
FTLVAGGGIDYDLDHLLLGVSDPEQTRISLAEFGCVSRGPALHVADKHIALQPRPSPAQRPLLDRLGLRVQSVAAIAALAGQRDFCVDERVAEGAFGIVLPGAERVRLHFVERPARAS